MKMSGWLKALPIAFAVAVLSVVTTSCASNHAQLRVINAASDSTPVDIYANGTKIFSNLAFTGVLPNTNPATYLAVTAEGTAIQGYPAGDDITLASPTGRVTFEGTMQYTMVVVGQEYNDTPPLLLTDDNSVPVSGGAEFRIINASPSSSPKGLDVYIIPQTVPPTVPDLTNYTPQVSGLGNSQASNYQTMTFNANGYNVIITLSGSKTAYITQPFTLQSGSIRTLVLVDNTGDGNGTSQTPIVLNDLN